MRTDNDSENLISTAKDGGGGDKILGFQSIVLQGEWCGEGIQKNRLKLKKPEWFVFIARVDDKTIISI